MNRRELVLLLAGAMTTAHASGAQQKVMPVLGYLNGTSLAANALLPAASRQGLGETGWVEGQNLAIEYRWAEFHYERLPALARRSRQPQGRCHRSLRWRQRGIRGEKCDVDDPDRCHYWRRSGSSWAGRQPRAGRQPYRRY
jgi:hypothetical protein